MRKLTAVSVFLLLVCGLAQAQHKPIKGIVRDTAEKKNLVNSVVALLNRSDSTLVRFTRTNQSGTFELNIPVNGNFFLLVTHPTYADYFQNIEFRDGNLLPIDTVPMILRSQLLQEVVVRQQLGAIRLKKDTTEYIADSFKVAANASVEDLLRRLPGVQVDKDGKIKAQGEDVQKILVDGEEFFGDDPTMVTQNLRADAVDKVQVFDKKSDQAAFTGIDDGQKTKTINLKLKEDKKNGYFGRAELGGGLPDKFNNQAMLNAFKGKRKLSAFGIMSNTGRTGLGWGDQRNYGGGESGNMEFDEGSGGMYITNEGDDFGGGGGNFYGQGLPTSWSAGAHYSNKWNGDKHKFNSNYRFNKLNTVGSGTTKTQNILPDTVFYRNEVNNNTTQRIRNRLDGLYEVQLDSFSSFKFTANGSIGKSASETVYLSESLTEESSPVNSNIRKTSSKGDNSSFNSNAIWRKRFAKAGRTISVTMDQKFLENSSTGFLQSITAFYKGGAVTDSDTIDQQKLNNNRRFSINSKASYTEPLSKKVFLELNYGIGVSNSQSERITYNKEGDKYEEFVDSLSTNYKFDVLTNTGGASLRVNHKKINYNFGGSIAHSAFEQKDLFADTLYKYYYVNFFPRANFNWNIKPQTRINFRYNGNTRQPTIDQLQPLRDNSDPLNVYIGNPNLKQEFRHNIGGSFSDFKVMNNRGIWSSFSFNLTDNAISNSDYVDSLGRKVYQPVNVDGNFNYWAYFSYSFKWKKLNIDMGFDINANGSRNLNIVNNQENITRENNFGGGWRMNYFKEKKFRFDFYAGLTYNTSVSSIQESLETRYWSSDQYLNATIFLPLKFELGSNVDVNLRQKTALFDKNRNVVKWNASVSKKFTKSEAFLLKFQVNDILDQNIGVDRNISSNFVSERSYETLRRFWLVSFTWNFSKNGKPASSFFD